jgi:hypothetical protein
MKPRVVLPLIFLLVACGRRPAEPVAPAPGPGGTSSSLAPDPLEREDPGVVRCGIDDRPRPVGDLAPDADERAARAAARGRLRGAAERSLIGDRMVMPFVPEEPLPEVTITAGPLRLGPAAAAQGGAGGAVGAVSEGMVGAADPTVCSQLATEADGGAVELVLKMASTAEPLAVRVGTSPPSPFVRCLMERACQVRATPAAASATLTIPLAVVVTPPPPPVPPPPPPAPSPTLVVEASVLTRGSLPATPLQEQLVHLLVGRGNTCLGGEASATTTPLRLLILLRPRRVTRLDDAPEMRQARAPEFGRRAPMPPREPDAVLIQSIRSEGPVPPPLRAFVACLSRGLQAHPVAIAPPGGAKRATERAVLTIKFAAP